MKYLAFLTLLIACGGDDVDTPPDAPGLDAAPPDAPQTATLISNVQLDGYPHLIDIYVPSAPERAVVFLHGGGGSKEGGAQRELGIAGAPVPPSTEPTPDTAWLAAHHTVFVLPQGQHVDGAARAPTWSNYVMTSGADDVAFLSDLAGALRAGTLDARVPAVSRVHLAGHSNGGMMANRMWCEAPAVFDAYSALSGPASVQLSRGSIPDDPLAGAHPCTPSVARPYLGVVGDADTIIQTAASWTAPTWAINTCLQSGSGDAFVDPGLLNELLFQRTVRLPARCTGAAAEPTTTGNVTRWSDCDGSLQLLRIAGAEHCVLAGALPCMNNKLVGGDCTASLEARLGSPIRDLLLDFFVAQE